MKTENDIILRFKTIFRTSGLTKSQFSKLLKIDHQSLNKYLSGVYDIQKISMRLFNLGYSIHWLYSGVTNNNPSAALICSRNVIHSFGGVDSKS